MTLAADPRAVFTHIQPAPMLRRLPANRASKGVSSGTLLISTITLLVLLALWFIATQFGWASPLFLLLPRTTRKM